METLDYSVRFDHTDDDLTADDFEFEGVSVDKPTVYSYQRYAQTGYGYYEDSDGAVRYGSIGAGNYGYVVDDDKANQPDIEIYGSVKSGTEEGDNWVRYGTVSYRSGSAVVEAQNGASVSEDGRRLLFPKGTGVTDIKTCLSTKTAGVTYTMHPYVRLKPTERIRARVDQLFMDSDTPETILRNTARPYFYDFNGDLILACGPKSADDYLTGAASGISMDKSVKYDTDKDGQTTTLHYTANVYEQTNLTNLADYNEAAAAGVFTPDTAGTFYDLLPKGVEPRLGTVKLNGDNAVESVSLKRNYKGTGRTLMTVKARIASDPEYRSTVNAGNQPYDGYGNKITLTFDAVYSFDTERDYGPTLVNNIAYESAEPSWGTIAGYKGEPDNPLAGNNQARRSCTLAYRSSSITCRGRWHSSTRRSIPTTRARGARASTRTVLATSLRTACTAIASRSTIPTTRAPRTSASSMRSMRSTRRARPSKETSPMQAMSCGRATCWVWT